jgi:hypothetical protein
VKALASITLATGDGESRPRADRGRRECIVAQALHRLQNADPPKANAPYQGTGRLHRPNLPLPPASRLRQAGFFIFTQSGERPEM